MVVIILLPFQSSTKENRFQDRQETVAMRPLLIQDADQTPTLARNGI